MPNLANYGKKIKKIIIAIGLPVFLASCDYVTPGMRMNTSGMPVAGSPDVRIKPVLVPITATVIHNQRNFPHYYYLVGPQDVIDIQVWNHPEFNAPSATTSNALPASESQQPDSGAYGYNYLVGPDGKIFFPMIGNISVSGLTVEQIRRKLTQKLCIYIRKPQVQVRIISFRSQKIYVMGEVPKPGIQALTDVPLSITDAISLAGGVDSTTSDPSHIYIIRGSIYNPAVYWLNAKSPDSLILASNFQLQAHDIVYISTAPIVLWNRVVSQILPTIETIWYTNSLITNK
ncbi:MAG: polysaccharide biosynthesis/export family protein [Proteobacteria bacterium]|nr:polysaccharide biosynthesis/export family protein [Pseudomonadota bacterium]